MTKRIWGIGVEIVERDALWRIGKALIAAAPNRYRMRYCKVAEGEVADFFIQERISAGSIIFWRTIYASESVGEGVA